MRHLFAGLLMMALAPGAVQAADPSALWNIVNGKCVPHEQTQRDPSPCSEVDLAHGVDKGFVVLKDINGVAQFLLIPTARISGIDDPAILDPDATNYWDAAWRARYTFKPQPWMVQPWNVVEYDPKRTWEEWLS